MAKDLKNKSGFWEPRHSTAHPERGQKLTIRKKSHTKDVKLFLGSGGPQ